MPSMAAMALERLLEPNGGQSAVAFSASDRDLQAEDGDNSKKHLSARQQLFLFSPELAFPNSFPPSRDSSSPSAFPRVLNGNICSLSSNNTGAWPASSGCDGFRFQRKPDAHRGVEFCLAAGKLPMDRRKGNEESGRLDASCRGEEKGTDGLEREVLDRGVGEDDDEDGFWSPRETRSVTSCCSGESSAGFGSRTPNHTEFYDAIEDFISDGSASQSSLSLSIKYENELCTLRVNLIEEIERRKTTEMALLHMQTQWRRLAESLSQIGVTYPASQQAGGFQLEIDPAELCQEILVTRYVSEAVERGLARAETEAAAQAVVDMKNHEISRLRERIHYYEAVNREMSLRNQEIIKLARQNRVRRRRQRRWIWSGLGLAVLVGASMLASSHLGYTVDDLLTLVYHNSEDASCDGSD
ncbi:hypothetical protein C4D60_Mb01t07030 [Musa balbisiana]|uniref:Transmembrane protein n=1 Tax=Musa balbisiana TaxID=52838 RepID=A0A4S8JKN7_MUSBA|nr:hypothetical protein C4D60_Mb01t07030 [Musa balbisiana]